MKRSKLGWFARPMAWSAAFAATALALAGSIVAEEPSARTDASAAEAIEAAEAPKAADLGRQPSMGDADATPIPDPPDPDAAEPPIPDPPELDAPKPPPSAPEPDSSDADAEPAMPVGPPANARDLLRWFGVDDSQLDRLVDGRPLTDDDVEPLLKVLFHLRRFQPGDIERWARPASDVPKLVEDPAAWRTEVIALRGRVLYVEPIEPSPEDDERYEMPRYYRCELTLDGGQRAVVFTEVVPAAWEKGGAIDARGEALGLFLKLAAEMPDLPRPVFAARRLAWYRDDALGRLGFDAGLFDSVAQRRPIGEPDREAFYQMLAAAGRTKPGELLDQATELLNQRGEASFSVVPLFNEPARSQGDLVVLSGTAREVLRIAVDDPDVVARFGIDHYYQVAMFTEDSQHNPLVFCVREIPPGMPVGSDPRYAEYVQAAGFMFKSWAFRTARSETAEDARSLQAAPLLIGRDLVWFVQPEPARNVWFGAIAGGLFVLALGGIWVAMWRYSRADRRFQRETMARTLGFDSGIALDQLPDEIRPDRDSSP